MDAIYRALGWPLGWGMWVCYNITNSYGMALLIFTIIIRLALFPLSLKQQKSTVKMQMIKPLMDEIQAKYKNNKEKLNQEILALYQKEGYNPASGCLPLLIQMPILFGLIEVIYRPLKHILRLPADVIVKGEEIVLAMGLLGKGRTLKSLNSAQIFVIQEVQNGVEAFNVMGAEAIEKIMGFQLSFLGMDLGVTPTVGMFLDLFKGAPNPVILIPVLSGISALAVSLLTMKNNPATEMAGANASMKSMMYMMPIFSTMIAFSVPAGVGLYWFYSNLVSMVQTVVLNKFYNPKEMAEKAKLEMEERREKERLERIEAKKLAKEQGAELQEKALTQKEINRKKLAEARKRAAEKYGEEYVEVTDEDLN